MTSDQEYVLLGDTPQGREEPPSLQISLLGMLPNWHFSKCWFLPSRRLLSPPVPSPKALLGLAGWCCIPLFAKLPWWMASRMTTESVVFISPMSQPFPLNHCLCWQLFVHPWQPGFSLAAPSAGLPAGKGLLSLHWQGLEDPFLQPLSQTLSLSHLAKALLLGHLKSEKSILEPQRPPLT